MEELLKLMIGLGVLLIGIPLGNFLARITKDEQKKLQKKFKILTYIGIIVGFVGLIIKNDVILFTFFFIAIVTSRSIKK